MNEQRYILTVQNNNVFKEVDVSEDTPLLKIGTLQDCDVRIKRELFDIPVSLTLCLEKNDWRISCNDEIYMSLRDDSECSEASISHGDILTVHNRTNNESILTLLFAYDVSASVIDFDTIIDVRNVSSLVIGKSESAQIKLSSEYIDSEYITLTRGSDKDVTLDAAHAPKSATVNGIRVLGTTVIQEYDFIGIADYSFYYKNQVLYTTMRDDLRISGISSQPLRDETPAFEYPMLNRSPRMLYSFNTEPIVVLDPPAKPEKPKDNIVMQLLPALLMIAITVLFRTGIVGDMNTGNTSFVFMSLAMMLVGIFTSVMGIVSGKKRYREDVAKWNSDYTAYIANKRREIEAEQRRELATLIDTYPKTEQIRDFVKTFSGRLFERSSKDKDFLHVRIGYGAVPALRKPSYNRAEHIKVENELAHLPEQLCSEYALINSAPVMLHLRESGTVGMIGTPDEQYEAFKNILLDICVVHDYEEVHTVVLIPPDEQQKYDWMKWLPHLKESGGGVRGIVCDDESRDNVYEHLYAVLSERGATSSHNAPPPIPHIIVFVLEEHGIKTHPLFKFAEISATLGVSFVYFKQYAENLPKYCPEIVELSPHGGTLKLSNDKAFGRAFASEQVRDESIKFVAERLAPVYYEKIALSSRLTTNISLFELLNILSTDDLNLLDRWSKSNVQKSLAAPLGIDVKGGTIDLDLHERAHGPHGLIAGTTGSGKSEIMQSYILSVAASFHPYEVAFVIIDFKGGGMANQFEDLPHLIGKITDIDSHEIERSLLSIRAELEKRKRLFAEFDVNHIDHYIAKYKSGETKTALPHLILIVDEFAELKAEQPEFMKELISTARVGRSLGIHLILATQKPAGQVSEQIWSNSRFKLCLKVATKEDSTEVLKSPLAYEIREPGRAYLQVGNNEVFLLFQSAYSGASVFSDESGNMREFAISEVSFTGKRTLAYERKAERTSDGIKMTQLKAMVDYVNKYCIEHDIARLQSICMPPLPERVDYAPAVEAVEGKTTVLVGIYDDPSNQVQPGVHIDLSEGNVIIVGSAQTGKTMLLQTMLRGIAEHYTPNQASAYILDFASKVLKIYEDLNHVGGVLTDSDEEDLKNFFKMIQEEIDERKKRFSNLGVSSFESYLEMEKTDAPDIPHIIIMLDNLLVFKEMFQDYEDAMLNICREGLALGITVIATAKQTSGVSYRYLSNFSTRVAFNCNESAEYANIFDKCRIQPKNVQGRGLIAVDKVIHEYQAYLPFDGETESKRIEQAKTFISATAKKYGSRRARKVPSIPQILTEDYFDAGKFGKFVVPVGLTYEEIEPVTIDLSRIGTVGIYGREGFGKSNLVRIILSYLQRNVFELPCEAYLIDGYDRQLAEFKNFGFVEQYSIDCADFEEVVQKFTSAASSRMDILRMGGNLENEPLLLCIVQNTEIFAADKVPSAVFDQYKKLVSDAKQLKICCIFSNLDNNGEFSPPDMLKIARDYAVHFLLDDIANVMLFGSSKFSAIELKPFKKPILLGDGYTYSPRSGIEKIKLIKSEGGV